MADDGDAYERFFRARDPHDTGDDADAGSRPPPLGSPSRSGAPHRRGAPSGAQERLMASIAAGRKARQRRAFLVAGGVVSALVLFVAGAGWALTGYINHLVGRVD